MLFGSLQLLLCAVKGKTCSLKEQTSWMPWMGTMGIIDPVWKQRKDGGKDVKTCLDHPQTEGLKGDSSDAPFPAFLP